MALSEFYSEIAINAVLSSANFCHSLQVHPRQCHAPQLTKTIAIDRIFPKTALFPLLTSPQCVIFPPSLSSPLWGKEWKNGRAEVWGRRSGSLYIMCNKNSLVQPFSMNRANSSLFIGFFRFTTIKIRMSKDSVASPAPPIFFSPINSKTDFVHLVSEKILKLSKKFDFLFDIF